MEQENVTTYFAFKKPITYHRHHLSLYKIKFWLIIICLVWFDWLWWLHHVWTCSFLFSSFFQHGKLSLKVHVRRFTCAQYKKFHFTDRIPRDKKGVRLALKSPHRYTDSPPTRAPPPTYYLRRVYRARQPSGGERTYNNVMDRYMIYEDATTGSSLPVSLTPHIPMLCDVLFLQKSLHKHRMFFSWMH